MVVFGPQPQGPRQRMGVCPRQLEQSVQWAWEAAQLFTESEAQQRPFDARPVLEDPAELPLKPAARLLLQKGGLGKAQCGEKLRRSQERAGQPHGSRPELLLWCHQWF